MGRRFLVGLILGLLVASLLPAASAQAGPPGRYIVVLKDWVQDPGAVARDHARDHGAEVSHVYSHALKGYAAELPRGAAEAVARDRRVALVEADQKVKAFGEVPTGVDRIEDDLKLGLSDTSAVSKDIDIAILDTGISSHDDLTIAGGWNCATGGPFNQSCEDGNFADGNGHGTHVAGTAAAIDHANGIGVVGVCPGCRLWAVKVLDNNGSGWISWIVAGIDKVTENADTIEVANMSLGCACESEPLDTALNNSTTAGVVYVVAAGNDGEDASGFSPANHDKVIAVSAVADYDGMAGGVAAQTCRTDSGTDDTFAPWSNFGDVVDLAAPGVCILSTVPGGYDIFSGTSMASPHGAGAAALYILDNNVGKSKTRWSTVRSGLREEGTNAATDGQWSVLQSDTCGTVEAGKSLEPVLMLFLPCTVASSGGGGGGEETKTGMHVGDLDGSSANNGSTWTASVTITVHDASGNPLSEATVSGTWSGGASGPDSCTPTGDDGKCTVVKGSIPKKNGSVTFTVTDVTHPDHTYSSTDNHDPDGDSNGTSITVSKP